jgi:hypothetical protein
LLLTANQTDTKPHTSKSRSNAACAPIQVQISTSEYKIKPIKVEVRRRLGYPHPTRVPAGVWAQMAIGISVDEIHRARTADVAYMRNVFPLLDLGWRRDDCARYLAEHGLTGFVKSSCVGCPFHDDGFWVCLKADSPTEWADAVAFDTAIRNGSARATAEGHPLRGEFFLHRQRVPLGQVVLRTGAVPEADEPGCGPWTCPHDTETDSSPVFADADSGRGWDE